MVYSISCYLQLTLFSLCLPILLPFISLICTDRCVWFSAHAQYCVPNSVFFQLVLYFQSPQTKMLSTDQELKVSRMAKRSQNKKLFGRDNYRLREFVLLPYCIRYFEVSGGNRGKEKGQLMLSNVKFIEKVQDDELDNKKNVFQIAYADDAWSTSSYILYIVANSASERDDWISLVRFYTREQNARFVPRYHPGVWKRPGRYTCCDDINRRSMGCQPTNEPGPPVVVEQLWRAVSGVDQPVIHATAAPMLSASTTANNSPPCTFPNSVNMPMGIGVPSLSSPSTIQPSCGEMISTPIAANITPGSAILNPHASPIPLSALHPSMVPTTNTTLVTPITGVIMSTPTMLSTTTTVAIAATTTSPTTLFQLQQQQHALLMQKVQQQQQQKQQQLAMIGGVGVNQLVQPGSGVRRSGHNQHRSHPMRYTHQTLFDMDDSENTVIAVHNYNPVRENQLPLQKGEKYYVVNQSNAQWWYVRNMAGQLGYVPTNYVHKPNSLNSFDWYYKDITRQQAEAILLDEGREGTTAVTNGTTTATEAQYYLSEKHAFPTISDVIHYHKYNSGGLVVRLRSPPTKDRESPVTAGMGLDEFELDPAELQLEPEPIGKGQFGVVKRGKFNNIPVAVKQMVEGAMNEDDFIEEAKNMRFLNHPNLVQLFGVVLKKRPIMIITEYMKHGSLRDFMRQRQSLFCNRPVVLADICAQVANGMAYLEQEQFVHRDLAARNCLVKSVSRNSVHVKVADFGMARFLLDNVYEPSAGTKFPVRWAPPEVFQSTYTAKADVWSFGKCIVLCQILTEGRLLNISVRRLAVIWTRTVKIELASSRPFVSE
ncbi:hypothetical protein PHET_04102 [Paragonimus heterotremus]|uniref:non-specific protein-tyrosine kinase n=1 Tax=Paragonimus heterotremus TaxID=100268 RepID=A0A8J4T9G9_9TREM|nr:hypothetical protein PHET_04102 [Paragonimus heterotremus]